MDVDVFVYNDKIQHIRYHYMKDKIQPGEKYIQESIRYRDQHKLLESDKEYIKNILPEFFL